MRGLSCLPPFPGVFKARVCVCCAVVHGLPIIVMLFCARSSLEVLQGVGGAWPGGTLCCFVKEASRVRPQGAPC